MGLRANAGAVDDDKNPASQEPTLVPTHDPVDAADQDDNYAGAASRIAPPPAKGQRR